MLVLQLLIKDVFVGASGAYKFADTHSSDADTGIFVVNNSSLG